MDKIDLYVIEYKATQEFVMHYERLIWYIGSILNASVVVLAGLVFTNGENPHFLIVWLVSVIVSFIWYRIECRFRIFNTLKLGRLHELEEVLKFRQSLYIRDYDLKEKPRLKGHRLISLACILMPVAITLFIIVDCFF